MKKTLFQRCLTLLIAQFLLISVYALKVGETTTLSVGSAGVNHVGTHPIWIVHNPDVIDLISDGETFIIIKAIAEGTCGITCEYWSDTWNDVINKYVLDSKHTQSWTISVSGTVESESETGEEEDNTKVDLGRFYILGNATRTVTVGDNISFMATATNELNFDPASVTWRSSDSNVLEFLRSEVLRNTYPYGYFKAKSVGTATVTATCCGNRATCTVIVKEEPVPLTSISISDTQIKEGSYYTLQPVRTPTNGADELIWTSSNPDVATVSGTTGRVYAVNEGTTKITVTSVDNPSITSNCTVTVIKNLTAISSFPNGETRNSHTIPSVTFNCDIREGENFGGIQLLNGQDPVAGEPIIVDSILYFVPNDVLASGTYTFFVPEKAVLHSNVTNLALTKQFSLNLLEVCPIAAANNSHSVALMNDGSLWSWGANTQGQVGSGTTSDRIIPEKVLNDVVSVSLGTANSLAVKCDGSLWAWGKNDYGQLGDGTTTNHTKPVKVLDDVASVSTGGSHSLAIKSDGSLWAWGANGRGQVGDGTTTGRPKPVKVLDNVVSISAMSNKSFAIKSDGSLWAWGASQLGDGTITDRTTPVKVLDDVVSISIGQNHNFAIKNDGGLWAWGYNTSGQLGDGTTTNRTTPVKVLDDVVSVSIDNVHSLAIKSDGSLWAWGANDKGQVGDGTTTKRTTPVKVLDDVVSVSSETSHSLAIKSDGSLWAWGDNRLGYLGDGTKISRSSPVKVIDDVVFVTTDSYHTLAIKSDSSLWAWGANSNGQLGDGTTTARSTPVKIFDTLYPTVKELMSFSIPTQTCVIIGDKTLIPQHMEPVDVDYKSMEWSSSDESIATVSNRGVVTGVALGEAILTVRVTSKEGTVFERTCTVVVEEAPPVIVTAKDITVEYGEPIPTLDFEIEGYLIGQPVLNCEATQGSPVGEYRIVVSQGDVSSDNVTYINGILTITPAPLTITAKNYEIRQGEPFPAFEATYSGFKNDETPDVLTKLPTFFCQASPNSEVGTYELHATGAEADNYEITYEPGTLTISNNTGSSFTANIIINGENETATYRITDIGNHHVSVGDGENAVIDTWTEGNVKIPSSVTGSDGNTYQVTGIGDGAFLGCFNLTSVTLPQSIRIIGEAAFADCYELTTMDIPASVTNIGADAFHSSGLTEVAIPQNVATIGSGAFAYCNDLISVTVGWNEPIVIDEDCFTNAANATLHVPAKTKALYKAATGWKDFGEIIEMTGDEPGQTDDTDISQMDNVIYIENVEAFAGKQLTLSVKMKNTVEVQGFGFDLYLPDGVTVAKDEDGFSLVTLSTERTTEKKTNYFDSNIMDGGFLRVLASSTNGYTISGNDGEIVQVVVNIDKDMEEGDYPIILREIALSDNNSQGYETDYVKSTLTISSYTPGDVDGNGKINVVDFTAIANYILGKTPAGFIEKAADVDGNGKVNVVDLTAVANIILYGSASQQGSRATRTTTDAIFVCDIQEQ